MGKQSSKKSEIYSRRRNLDEQNKKRKNIKERFAGFNGEYPKTEIDWGNPVGKEIW